MYTCDLSHIMHLRISDRAFKHLQLQATYYGFETVSSYLRHIIDIDMALDTDEFMEEADEN